MRGGGELFFEVGDLDLELVDAIEVFSGGGSVPHGENAARGGGFQ